MDDLVTWLRAQLDDDERVARSAGWDHPEWTYDRETFTVASDAYAIAAGKDRTGSTINDVDGEHIARWDPARVLAEVDAKRRVIETLRSYEPNDQWDTQPDMGLRLNNAAGALRALAVPYADRPGYRESWRPSGSQALTDIG